MILKQRQVNVYKGCLTQKHILRDHQLGTFVYNSQQNKFHYTKSKGYSAIIVAHLDSELVMQIPELDLAQKSSSYPYDYLLATEDEGRLLYWIFSQDYEILHEIIKGR